MTSGTTTEIMREDGKCRVIYKKWDLGMKGRIQVKDENGDWLTVGYFPELIEATQCYYKNYSK